MFGGRIKRITAMLSLAVVMLIACKGRVAGATFNLTPHEYTATTIACQNSDGISRFAAEELQKHLAFVTGYKFPITKDKGSFKKAFYVGEVPAQDKKKLANEESRYLVTPNAVYMYGEDHITVPAGSALEEVTGAFTFLNTLVVANRAGTLFAVYKFLENELGVDWVEPGDGGIMYTKKAALSVPVKSFSWVSQFKYQRSLRTYMWAYDNYNNNKGRDVTKIIPADFRSSTAEVNFHKMEDNLWQKRMGMGNRGPYIVLGHGFTEWWTKYGKTHPEYFSLNGDGKREPVWRIERVKMDPSQPKLVQQIVDDWWAGKGEPKWMNAIDACENDSDGHGLDEYCHCDACIAEDALKPGEEFGANLTDRYVRFWNQIVGLAREKDPNAVVSGYAYERYITPPRHEKVADGVVLGFVTGYHSDWAKTSQLYENWEKAGAKEIILRPNDLWSEIGIPQGIEKRVLEHFQLAVKYGAAGTDYDGYNSMWTGDSGFTYYILAKAHQDPSKPFEYWENKYAALFGSASEDVKAFHRYWREEIFDKRLFKPEGGHVGGQGHILEIDKCYNEEDFNTTDGYLRSALAKRLSPVQRRFIERMLIANQHSRLTYRAMLAVERNDKVASTLAAKDLMVYRRSHKEDIYTNWPMIFFSQAPRDEAAGIDAILGEKN